MNGRSALVRLASIAIATGAVWMLLHVPEPPPEEAVRQTFAAYKRAILAGDGATAAALMSAGTVQWYGMTQELALHGTKEEVERLSPLEKIQVLACRQRVPADTLRAMSAQQLIAYAVAQGWTGKAAAERSELGTLEVSGDTASAQLLLAGKNSGAQYHFVKEAGRWRFDQLPMLQAGSEGIKVAAAQRGMGEDQFVLMLVEAGSGTKVSTDLWNPPFPRGAMPGTE